MALPASMSAPLAVDDIAALSDAELAEFMKKHRRPNGDFELPIDRWDKLSKDGRSRLAGRLKKAQERAIARSPTACFVPLDLDALDRRLRDVVDGNNPFARDLTSFRARRTETPLPDFEAISRENETQAYHDLINAGGRPLYTIDRLEEVFENPDEHSNMMYPWDGRKGGGIWAMYWRGGVRHWELFQTQLARWQEFGKWQNDNRGIQDDDDGSFTAYVESRRQHYELYMHKEAYVKWLAEIEADPSSAKSDWERDRRFRQLQRETCREIRCDGFSQYVEAVKRRLARHDFARSFRLHEDPKQQDKLTTWIEYLNFEYWWLDRYTKSIEHLKPAHDKAWQELVGLNMVRPHETPESVRTVESSRQEQAEEDGAQAAVEMATLEAGKVYKTTQQDPQRLRIPRSKRTLMMRTATNKLNAAKERLQWVKRRNEEIIAFVQGTFGYVDAKKDASRQSKLVQWALEQVPSIEAEMARSHK